MGQLTAEASTLLQWLANQGEGVLTNVAKVQERWPDSVGAAITLLLRRELIEYYNGGYRFQVGLIRRGFAQKQ